MRTGRERPGFGVPMAILDRSDYERQANETLSNPDGRTVANSIATVAGQSATSAANSSPAQVNSTTGATCLPGPDPVLGAPPVSSAG